MTWRATRRRDSPFPSLLPFYASPNTLSSPLPIPVPPAPCCIVFEFARPSSEWHSRHHPSGGLSCPCVCPIVRACPWEWHSRHHHSRVFALPRMFLCLSTPPQKIVCLRGPQVSGTHGTTPHEVRAPYLANSYLACVPFDQAVPSSFFVVHACSLVWCRPTCCLLLRVPPIAHRALGRNGCSFSLIRREGD